MSIRYAIEKDLIKLYELNALISKDQLVRVIKDLKVLVFEDMSEIIGTLRFSYLWGYIPFMDLLYVKNTFRKTGIGTRLTFYFEKEMAKNGHKFVLTSTQVDEQAQHFYRRIGYIDNGSILLPNQAAELFLIKHIK